ncbi:MAG TPA: hypothetical protein PKV21_06125 [bacterium]|nr:hypothetical protein [bacterium]HOM27067.1 hypothetical protein [bacterium]
MKKILFLMKEKNLLEKYLFLMKNYEYETTGFLLHDKKLMEKIDKLENVNIVIIEVDECGIEIKKVVKKLKEKFKDCKFLILIPEINDKIQNFIIDFSIDSYLVFPVLPFQLLRSIFLLNNL